MNVNCGNRDRCFIPSIYYACWKEICSRSCVFCHIKALIELRIGIFVSEYLCIDGI